MFSALNVEDETDTRVVPVEEGHSIQIRSKRRIRLEASWYPGKGIS